jgi:hypothetical protein
MSYLGKRQTALQKKGECAFKFSELVIGKGGVQVFLAFRGEERKKNFNPPSLHPKFNRNKL